MDLAGQVKEGTWVIVKSGSFLETATVHSGGNFKVGSVPIPYDVWVIVEGPDPWGYDIPTMEVGVTASIGLTSPNPTLLDLTRPDPTTAHLASISGRVSGGIGFPTPDDFWTGVAFSSPAGSSGMLAGDTTTVSSRTGAYLTDVHWSGPSTTRGTLHALQWQQGSHGPASYSGYGAASVPLTDAGVRSLEIPLTALTPARFSGTYTPPPDYGGGWETFVRFGADVGGLRIGSGDAGAFSVLTPDVADATVWMRGHGYHLTDHSEFASSVAIRSNLAVDAMGVAVTSPPAAELNWPESGAGGVNTGTRFTWTGPAGGLSILYVTNKNSYPNFYVLTSESSASIPDLAGGGPMLVYSSSYTWRVVGVGPFASVDAAAPGISSLLNSFGSEGGPEGGAFDGYVTQSLSRTFTTAH